MTRIKKKKTILVKNSIADYTREIVESDYAIVQALSENYANLSALARKIDFLIKEKTNKKVNIQAIISALKRIRNNLKISSRKNFEVLATSSLSVRTDLAKISVKASKLNAEILTKMMEKFYESIVQISWSPTAYTIVFDEILHPNIISSFKKEEILEDKKGLAAIIVHSSENIIETPGCVSSILNKIALREINIEDVVSTYTYTLLLFKREDIIKAFDALNSLISECRRVKS
jgi:hypothetical protein